MWWTGVYSVYTYRYNILHTGKDYLKIIKDLHMYIKEKNTITLSPSLSLNTSLDATSYGYRITDCLREE